MVEYPRTYRRYGVEFPIEGRVEELAFAWSLRFEAFGCLSSCRDHFTLSGCRGVIAVNFGLKRDLNNFEILPSECVTGEPESKSKRALGRSHPRVCVRTKVFARIVV